MPYNPTEGGRMQRIPAELYSDRIAGMNDTQLRGEVALIRKSLDDLGFPLSPDEIIASGEQLARDFGLARRGQVFAPSSIQCIEGIRRLYPTAEDVLGPKDPLSGNDALAAQTRITDFERTVSELTTLNREWVKRNGESLAGVKRY